MQAQGAAQRVGTIPRRGRRLEALIAMAAVVVIVATMSLLARGVVAPATGGAQDANLKMGTGTAVVHDDAGNMPLTGSGSALVHDDAGNMPSGVGTAVVHDDAGNLKPR